MNRSASAPVLHADDFLPGDAQEHAARASASLSEQIKGALIGKRG